jgi:hypothetical protein
MSKEIIYFHMATKGAGENSYPPIEPFITIMNNENDISSVFDDEWAKELKIISSVEGFDPYSFWGERKIKKLAKKHAQKTSGLIYLEGLTAEEIRKRDKYKEEQMYSGKGKYKGYTMSTEEFLEREQIKTESYKTGR